MKVRDLLPAVASLWRGQPRLLQKKPSSNALTRSILMVVAPLLFSGCAADRVGLTNINHPGPALGQATGATVGAVGGNVAGAVVGFGEGVAAGAAAPFDNTKRVVRRWRTEVTADGRTIQVPEEIVVDSLGRPVHSPR